MAKKDKGKKEKPKEDEAKTAELRRQQQIAAKAELRKKMEEEAHISKLNSLKIVNQWRKIMRLAKAESLKKDIDILSQNHTLLIMPAISTSRARRQQIKSVGPSFFVHHSANYNYELGISL
jgi:hypothetical protein